MFRIKLQIDPKVLDKYQSQVKTGVRGMGFVCAPTRPFRGRRTWR